MVQLSNIILLIASFFSLIYVLITAKDGRGGFTLQVANDIQKTMFFDSIIGLIFGSLGLIYVSLEINLGLNYSATATLLVGIILLFLTIKSGLTLSVGYLSKFTLLKNPVFMTKLLYSLLFLVTGLYGLLI
jgi:hypothetical protein